MRVAFYNQMFGLNGRNPVSFFTGHWAMHFQPDPKRIYERTNLNNTIDTIKRSKADIIGVCEILETQERES